MSADRNNPVGRFEIYMQDMRPAKAFYESVFGTQFTKLENPGLEPAWNCGPSLGNRPAMARRAHAAFRLGLVYFSCADCAVEAAKAEKAGGRIQKPKMSIGPMAISRSSSTPKAT